MPLGLKGLATGIGSLPHKNVNEALDLIFKYCPEVPFWPQLPRLDAREGMVAQFSEKLPGFKMTSSGLFFDSQQKEQELEGFYQRAEIDKDIDYFKITPDYAQGLYAFRERLRKLSKPDLDRIKYIKMHITGPFTFAASVKDEKGVALLHDSIMMEVILKGLTMKAIWQIRFFEKFGKKIIVFIDEPYLGCFGSAYTPINREDVVKGLIGLTDEIKKTETALLGVHCCGNTDWSIFTDVKLIDIISFDAFGFLDRLVLYARDLKGFFDRGGALCWGIVPTQEFKGTETPDSLVKMVNDGINTLADKGINRDTLCQDLFFSPACGLGALDIVKSSQIFKLLLEITSYYKK